MTSTVGEKWQQRTCCATALAVALLSLPARPIAAVQCMLSLDAMTAHLLSKYDEIPEWTGVSNVKSMTSLFVAPDGGTWSVVITQTTGISCIVNFGGAWLKPTVVPGVEG